MVLWCGVGDGCVAAGSAIRSHAPPLCSAGRTHPTSISFTWPPLRRWTSLYSLPLALAIALSWAAVLLLLPSLVLLSGIGGSVPQSYMRGFRE